MPRTCYTCSTSMRYMGEWPCLTPSRGQTIQCHRWACDVCKTYPYEPVTPADAQKLEVAFQ